MGNKVPLVTSIYKWVTMGTSTTVSKYWPCAENINTEQTCNSSQKTKHTTTQHTQIIEIRTIHISWLIHTDQLDLKFREGYNDCHTSLTSTVNVTVFLWVAPFIFSTDTLTDRLGMQPTLPDKVSDTIDTMLNYNGDFDAHGDDDFMSKQISHVRNCSRFR